MSLGEAASVNVNFLGLSGSRSSGEGLLEMQQVTHGAPTDLRSQEMEPGSLFF